MYTHIITILDLDLEVRAVVVHRLEEAQLIRVMAVVLGCVAQRLSVCYSILQYYGLLRA